MIKLDGIIAFVAVAEAKSISEAARQLKLSKSVVSERLAEIERSLGATLVQRTTRKVSLTEDGLVFYEKASRIVRDVADATAEISERRGALVGPLRIAAPVSFGSLHLGPALYPFLKENPGIELTLDLDDRFVDVAADGYDAVIRHGHIFDTRLVVKRLASSRRVLVASPDYLARCGTPGSLAELEQHRAITYTNRGAADWRFQTADGVSVIRTGTGLRVNNGIVMRDAAMAGLGIALLPTYMIATALATSQLSIVDVGAKAEGAVIHIAYPKTDAFQPRSARSPIASAERSVIRLAGTRKFRFSTRRPRSLQNEWRVLPSISSATCIAPEVHKGLCIRYGRPAEDRFGSDCAKSRSSP